MSQYSLAVRWRAEEIRTLAFGDISGTYAALGAAMDNPVVNYRIQNLTNQNVLVSYDGVTDHDLIAAGGFVLLDVSSNKGKGDALVLSKGDIVFVKEETSGPSSGSVYLSVYYASNN